MGLIQVYTMQVVVKSQLRFRFFQLRTDLYLAAKSNMSCWFALIYKVNCTINIYNAPSVYVSFHWIGDFTRTFTVLRPTLKKEKTNENIKHLTLTRHFSNSTSTRTDLISKVTLLTVECVNCNQRKWALLRFLPQKSEQCTAFIQILMYKSCAVHTV